MNNFIVTCHGWSASNWLAHVLNLHPDFLVSHSAANLINEDHANDIRNRIKEFHKGYVDRLNLSIAEQYDKIKSFKKANYYGSVHLYRLRDLPLQHERFGIPGSYNVVNLIRNPIDLVLSGCGQFEELFLTDINELHWTLGKVLEDKDFLYELAQKHDIKLGSHDVLPFICAARILGSLRLDLDAVEQVRSIENFNFLGHVRMEDLTTDADSFCRLIESLTNGEVSPDRNYLDKVLNFGKINTHKKADTREETSSYVRLNDWKKDVIQYYLKKYNIIEPYSQLGYNLDDVKHES